MKPLLIIIGLILTGCEDSSESNATRCAHRNAENDRAKPAKYENNIVRKS